MNVKSLRRWVPYLIALLILAAACFIGGNVVAERSTVNAQAPMADELVAPDGDATCTIVNVAVYDNRIHVRCQANVGGVGATIVYFAAGTQSTADARLANRYLSLLLVAQAFGKHPLVAWADSSSQNPPGCQVADCRRLIGVAVP